jgi:hypothetical protein
MGKTDEADALLKNCIDIGTELHGENDEVKYITRCRQA